MAINDTRTDARTTPPLAATRTTTSGGLNAIDWIALVLMIVGGLNWGLVGLFNFDLVAALFGTMTPVTRVVYVLVGLAALFGIFTAARLASHRRAV